MALTLIHPGETLIYSTRWFEDNFDQIHDQPAHLWDTIEVVIHDEQRNERLAALSQRPNLSQFLKSEARSHAYA
ncbi:MAG: hypothetical protein HS126_19020 [Anaerolineales bacterium]|nr:hypothetical protein [Anaerolineales bacterium]